MPAFLAALSFGWALHAQAQLSAPIEVAFLQKAPVIDGVLDAEAAALPRLALPAVDMHGGTDPPSGVHPTYRIGYTADGLYLYVEVDDGAVVSRDRAYQNGDGLELVLAAPRTGDSPSKEFYVLGFAAAPKAARPWQKRFVWYHDVALSFAPLRETRMATRSAGERTAVELLVPWSEVYPFHPWLSEAIGFNLCYVKASGATARTSFAAVADDRLQVEQSPRRYVRLRFAAPHLDAGVQEYAVLRSNHVDRGQAAEATVAVLSAAAADMDLAASVLSGEGAPLGSGHRSVRVGEGLTRWALPLPTPDLPPGGYTVKLRSSSEEPELSLGLSILPAFDPSEMTTRLARARSSLSAGSATTLEFELQEVATQSAALKPYDTATALRFLETDISEALAAGAQGEDRIARRTGLFRRAFRSKVDGSLQPYSVRVPVAALGKQPVPLIVFLHGSGEDDRAALRSDLLPDGYLQVAPFGRGTSNAYGTDHAQEDIREAVEDAMANYHVDPRRIVLAGFSMGGYGVYRTFREDPRRYRALAVFSGHPDLGRQFLGGDQPNFLDPKSLAVFKGVPMFIFHGGRDLNCPVELTRALVRELRRAGADVQFEGDPERGHELPSAATDALFRAWLTRVIGDSPR